MIVVAYFILMLGVGWRARGQSPESYWVATRRYGVAPLSASLVATVFGASSTVGIIGLGYARGLTGAWWALMGGLALIPFSLLLAGRVRRLEVYTLPDILHRAYGEKVSVAGAAVIVVAWCGVIAAQIVAGALLLGTVLPVSLQGALAVVAVVFVLYTLWGGQLSVVRTDSWQIVLFLGALILTLFLVAGSLMETGNLSVRISDGHLSFPISPGFGWYQLLVFYPLIVGMPYLVGPDIYSRVLCARDESTALRASLLAAFAVIPLSLLLAILGLLIHALSPGLSPEAALPTALDHLAPTGLRGLIVVGVLGAIMSSADTTLISAATILSLNVVSPLATTDPRGQLRMTRGFVVLVGGTAWAVATFQEGIIASLLLAYTVFVGGVALPTLASFWKDRLRIGPKAAFWAILLGGSTAFLGEFREGALLQGILGSGPTSFLSSILGPEYGSLLPLLVSVSTLFGLGWYLSRPKRPKGA